MSEPLVPLSESGNVNRQSREVGKTASVGQRQGYAVYEAIAPHECVYCERSIAPSERFTRRTARGLGSRRWPFCADCADAEVES